MRSLRLGLACAVLLAISSSAAVAQATGPFVGQIMVVGFNFCPKGWVPADGRLLPISQYVVLFNLYGTNFGGDGKTTFGVPDLRDRVIVGTGPVDAIGQQTGPQAGVLVPRPGGPMQRGAGLAMTVCVSAFGVFPSQN